MQGKLYKPVSNPSDPDALVASKILRWVFRSVQVLVWAWDKWRGGDEQQTGFTDMAQTAYYNWCHAILHHSLPCQATTYHTVPLHTRPLWVSIPCHCIPYGGIPYHTALPTKYNSMLHQTKPSHNITPHHNLLVPKLIKHITDSNISWVELSWVYNTRGLLTENWSLPDTIIAFAFVGRIICT